MTKIEKDTKQELLSEGALLAKNVINEILKTKKLFKIYPSNNPIYINSSETVFEKFKNFFLHEKELQLQISQHQISYNGEEIYHNPEKNDNLALFLFKDGIREITFSNGIKQKELGNFLNILAIDFEKEAPDDDIVTVLFEKNFEHIKYIADDILLTDEEMSEERKAYEKIKENVYTDDSVKKAYQDSLDTKIEDVYITSPLNEKDLQKISEKIKSQEESKDERFINILFELIYTAKTPETFRNISTNIRNTLGYYVKEGDFKNVSFILDKIRKEIDGEPLGKTENKNLVSVYSLINSSAFIRSIGKALESSTVVEETEYHNCIKHFDKNAIRSFVQLMGEIQNVKGRHLVVETLSVIGRYDIKALASGLQDTRWNTVRDTIIMLGKIGTSGTFEYLKKILTHTNEKVRREAVRTIGTIKNPDTFQCLLNALDDSDSAVRIIAARALGNIRTEEVKRKLLLILSRKDFSSRGFNEKKEFYTVITNWLDNDIKDLLNRTLKSWKIWNKASNNETRACAAYALGILKDTESIPLLTKTGKSKSRVLREYSLSAINKIKNNII